VDKPDARWGTSGSIPLKKGRPKHQEGRGVKEKDSIPSEEEGGSRRLAAGKEQGELITTGFSKESEGAPNEKRGLRAPRSRKGSSPSPTEDLVHSIHESGHERKRVKLPTKGKNLSPPLGEFRRHVHPLEFARCQGKGDDPIQRKQREA